MAVGDYFLIKCVQDSKCGAHNSNPWVQSTSAPRVRTFRAVPRVMTGSPVSLGSYAVAVSNGSSVKFSGERPTIKNSNTSTSSTCWAGIELIELILFCSVFLVQNGTLKLSYALSNLTLNCISGGEIFSLPYSQKGLNPGIESYPSFHLLTLLNVTSFWRSVYNPQAASGTAGRL